MSTGSPTQLRSAASLRRTPLYDAHRALGARLVPFAGWEMPVQYEGIVSEHHAVRRRAGLFDVSHMGEIEVRGKGALEVCQEVTANDVARLADGRSQYSLLCTPAGGVVDDIIVNRVAADRLLLCVNAANVEKDYAWIRGHARGRADVIDASAEYALLALQGPAATAILARCTAAPIAKLPSFHFAAAEIAGIPALASRTGYTGEDGWEIYVTPSRAASLWDALMTAGATDGIAPAGLGARDTLRLERALPLYGHELDESTTPLEAGLGWVVRMNVPFIGCEALRRQQAEGFRRRLVGIAPLEPGIPRQGYELRAGDEEIGRITSGTLSPTLGKAIGLGYVSVEYASVGTKLAVVIRRRVVRSEVVALPFYKRP